MMEAWVGISPKATAQDPADHSTIMAADHYMPPHSSQARAMPSGGFWNSSSASLVATGDPRVASQILAGNPDPAQVLPLDQPFAVETDQFVGIGLMQIKGLGAQSSGPCKWLSRTTFQGRLKQPVAAEDLWVGQFNYNKQRLPASFQKLVLTSAAKVFSSTSRVKYEYPAQPGDPHQGVYFLNPLLAMAKVVHVCPPGEVPPSLFDVPEDCSALGQHMRDKKGQPLSQSARSRWFDKPANLAAQVLDDVNTFTFVISQSVLDFAAYKLTLGGWLNLDLCSLLHGQPLQMSVYNIREHQLVLGVLMWHRNLNFRNGYSSKLHTSSSASSLLAVAGGMAGGEAGSCAGTGSTLSLQESSSGDSSSLQLQDSSSLDSSSCRAADSGVDAASGGSSPLEQLQDAAAGSSCGAEECCSCSDYGSACSDVFDVWGEDDGEDASGAQLEAPAAAVAAASLQPELQQQPPVTAAQQHPKPPKQKVAGKVKSLWRKHISKRSSSSSS